jgi:hypothetical protein
MANDGTAGVLRERERSNSANVIFRTALGIQVALEARSLGPGWSPLAWPFPLGGGRQFNLNAIGCVTDEYSRTCELESDSRNKRGLPSRHQKRLAMKPEEYDLGVI